jgi:hypothetical protein
MDKYEEMREFIKKNFSTTENKKDRLHTEDIIDILYRKGGFLYSTGKTAQTFKSMGIGEYKPNGCCINGKSKAGYYYLRYTGQV